MRAEASDEGDLLTRQILGRPGVHDDPIADMTTNPEYRDIHIESSLPKRWEEEQSFNDVLYDWMSRAPWLAISGAAHLLVFFIIANVPWNLIFRKPEKEITAVVEPPTVEEFEEPPEEIEEIVEEEITEEPILQDYEITETEVVEDIEESETDILTDSPFDEKAFNNVIGIGGGAGGKFGGRSGGRKKLRAAGGAAMEQALKDGLEWLKHHQSPDGSWDSDGFTSNCGKVGEGVCDSPGAHEHDVGLTGLALLAFLGDHNTLKEGEYKDVVSRGIQWLREQQDPDTGLIGEGIGHSFIYDHAIASLAMCEAYYFGKPALLRSSAQKALNYIMKARNPYGAWRYDVPPIGENDTSVTGWMIFALKSGSEAGLTVEEEALVGGLQWIDEVTDPSTGRVGYDSLGSMSSRVVGINDQWPPENGEGMTAVGLLCRIFMGQELKDNPIMEKHAELMAKRPPAWEPKQGCDMYYWYYGSYAMYQMGGRYWSQWSKAMKDAILPNQRQDGDFKGSWDPVGPWGWSGGRVYSTATMVLCLEVYYRYARILGAR